MKASAILSCSLLLLWGVSAWGDIPDNDPRFVNALTAYNINLANARSRTYKPLPEFHQYVDRKMTMAIRKRLGSTKRLAVEAAAAENYPYYQMGDTVQTKIGARIVTGKVSQILGNYVVVNGMRLNMRDFPEASFDKSQNERLRRRYVQEHFDAPRDEYRRSLEPKRDKVLHGLLERNGYRLHNKKCK